MRRIDSKCFEDNGGIFSVVIKILISSKMHEKQTLLNHFVTLFYITCVLYSDFFL